MECLLPLALVEVSGGENDVVTAVLGHELNTLHVVLLNQLSEVTVYHLLSNGGLILRKIWNLQEHTRGHVNAIEHLKVNVKMWWNESLLLLNFLLQGLLLLSVEVAGALSQALLKFWGLADVNKDEVAFIEQSESESAKSDLDDCSVE